MFIEIRTSSFPFKIHIFKNICEVYSINLLCSYRAYFGRGLLEHGEYANCANAVELKDAILCRQKIRLSYNQDLEDGLHGQPCLQMRASIHF